MPEPSAIDPDVDQLARELGYALVQDIAPEEKPFYSEIIGAYRQNATRKVRVGDHPLASGFEEILPLASPLIYDVSKIVIAFLLKFAADTATDTFKESITQIFAPNITKWIESKFSFLPKLHLTRSNADAVIAAVRTEMTKRKAPAKLTRQVLDAVQQALRSSIPSA